jgi:predicted Rossmann fold nucleotide-binding protein DprA/Smf involved in DNA uptake
MSELLESLEASRANCNFLKSKLDELSLEFMGLQDENDALRKQLETAVEALKKVSQETIGIMTSAYPENFHKMEYIPTSVASYAQDAIAEIEKVNNQLV